MKVIRLIETEESVKLRRAYEEGDSKEEGSEPEYDKVEFSFRLGLLRDFYIDPYDGVVVARLDNGLHLFEYDEELIIKLKFELNGH